MAKSRPKKKAPPKKAMPKKTKKAARQHKPAAKKTHAKTPKPKKLPSASIKQVPLPTPQPPAPSPLPGVPQVAQVPEIPTAAPQAPAPKGPLAPALDLLPPWEDRERLRRFMSEEGLSFSAPPKGSTDFTGASRLLAASAKKADASQPGYCLVSCADRNGKPVAAMDCYAINNIMVIMRARVPAQANRRDLHVLIYAAALAKMKPAYVVLAEPRALSFESACGIIFLGRGLGMSAIPLSHKSLLFLIRRIGKEADPVSDGKEIAGVLKPLVALFSGLEAPIAEIEGKDLVGLVPLPNSPDTREHLHELKDAVLSLGLPSEGLDKILQKLAEEYVMDRKDISPESF